MDSRIERVVLETARHRITGDLVLPTEGYRSRLSDFLNRGELEFIPLTDVALTSLARTDTPPPQHHSFLTVARAQVELAYPLANDREPEMPAARI
ncbi:hypothetical protein BH10ACT11_BH10ACT11_19590 [soil metagenome]